jgi:hypothetical protein
MQVRRFNSIVKFSNLHLKNELLQRTTQQTNRITNVRKTLITSLASNYELTGAQIVSAVCVSHD